MESFKIICPTQYQIKDVYNDNLDINIVFESGKVFFATVFTIENIKSLIDKDNEIYFWSADMFIVKDLKKKTIRDSVYRIIHDGYFDSIFAEIGSINSIFNSEKSYEDLIE